ncbi:MAG: FKBP-type peptidyl-prolyl cis-trans isomerase, partial [Rhodocyclaceae bacterium]|nr:FKBP-type peptidyl-prolyl cis-trans isomerase [Rhodocyclaceae bacterium]
VTLHYRIAAADGTELVGTFGSNPATLQMGSGELAPTLERCLVGLPEGEHHVFLLEPQQAFGLHNPELVQRVARSGLPPAAEVELHSLIEFAAPDGSKYAGLVREMDADSVLVDFNHPLAGKSIRFEVQVVGVL